MRHMLLAAALILIATQSHGFTTRTITLLHDGIERQALIDANADLQDAPVLVVLHGGLAGPRTVRRRSGVGLAREGWVVLWPSALGDWNDGRVDADGEAYDKADDIGFLRKLIDDLAQAGIADPRRVYFAGPSIGGIMVLRLICDAPELLAGAAVAIASLPEGGSCKDGPPRPILYIHGTDDGIMPPDGGRIGGWSPLIRDRGWVEPVAKTMARLAGRNGCDGFREARLIDRVPDDASTVLWRSYEGCDAPLEHYIIEGGGHTWPGSGRSRLSRIVGATNQDISATRLVEDFFKRLDARRGG
ncbi:MAG: hypothetical protein AAGH74_07135 [Pseudomonadota bacterium]